MTAICPAGPPKLSIATRAQTRTASARLTPCGLASRPPDVVVMVEASVMSGSRLPDWPVVGLVSRIAAPAVERIVEGHPGFELFEIVGIHPRQPQRGGQQAWRLGHQIGTGRV